MRRKSCRSNRHRPPRSPLIFDVALHSETYRVRRDSAVRSWDIAELLQSTATLPRACLSVGTCSHSE